MSDGSLSQDEIDALLQGTDNIEMEPVEASGAPFSDAEKNTFQSILDEVAESQGSNLSILTGKTVTLGKPEISVTTRDQLLGELSDNVVEVKIDFTEGVLGDHGYILSDSLATVIAGLMMGQSGGELDEAALSAVSEAISQITGSATTAIGNRIGKTIKTTPPDIKKTEKSQVRFPQGDNFIRVSYPIAIEGENPTSLTEVYSLALVKEIVSLASGSQGVGAGASTDAGMGDAMAALGGAMGQPGAAGQGGGQPNIFGGAPTGQMGMQQTFGQPVGGMASQPQTPPNVQPIQFANLQQPPVANVEQGNIGLLMDVYMELTVELGRTKRLIKDILGIGEGTIIELDKLAGEPVDILVNHKLIAKGEVVVIDENFGVRVTEIVSPMERMSDLT